MERLHRQPEAVCCFRPQHCANICWAYARLEAASAAAGALLRRLASTMVSRMDQYTPQVNVCVWGGVGGSGSL